MKRLLVAALLLAAAALPAHAFPIPDKPVRIVVPYPAAGPLDITARAIAQRLSPILGVPVVVENKPGASSILGTMEVVKAAPDGHTLLYTISNTVSLNPHLFAKLPYDGFRDLTPVMMTAQGALVLVASAKAPFGSVPAVMAHAKRNPGKVNIASYSPGSGSHLAAEMFKEAAGIDLLHIPFKGSPDANLALASGDVQLLFDAPLAAIQNAKAGKVKLLAYADAKRHPLLPDVPTLGEAGVAGMELTGGMQLFGPGGMPPDRVAKLNAALAVAVKSPEVAKVFTDGGMEVVASSPQELARAVREGYERAGPVIRRLGLKLD